MTIEGDGKLLPIDPVSPKVDRGWAMPAIASYI